jgi:hypothetical protein
MQNDIINLFVNKRTKVLLNTPLFDETFKSFFSQDQKGKREKYLLLPICFFIFSLFLKKDLFRETLKGTIVPFFSL